MNIVFDQKTPPPAIGVTICEDDGSPICSLISSDVRETIFDFTKRAFKLLHEIEAGRKELYPEKDTKEKAVDWLMEKYEEVLDQEEFDDYIHDICESKASNINNEGQRGQIEFLLKEYNGDYVAVSKVLSNMAIRGIGK